MKNSKRYPNSSTSNTKKKPYAKNLRLNVVTFRSSLTPFTCSFYRMPNLDEPDTRLRELNKYRLPDEYDKQDTLNPHSLYTDFSEHNSAPIQIRINPKTTNPQFLEAFYMHRVTSYFREQQLMVIRNFIRNPEVWIKLHEEDQPTDRLTRFDRYGLRIHIGRYTENSPELLISYRGTTDVLNVNLSNYTGDQDKITWVINRTPERVRYRDVIENRGHRPQNYFPVVNRSVREHEGIKRKRKKIKNRYKRDSRKIRGFYTTHIDSEAFTETTLLTSTGFFTPAEKSVNRVDISNHKMVFGNRETNRDPYFGMIESGPYRSSRAVKPRILIVAPEGEDNYLKQKLIDPFINGDGNYPGVQSMTGLPLKVMEPSILYTNRDNPLPEVKYQLNNLTLPADVQPIAFFFSTIPKNEQNLSRKEKFYHVKEHLLKNSIPSQGVNLQKIKSTSSNGVKWWHQHLSAATLAKLGGIPWKVGRKNENELIIGIGAFKHEWASNRFVGSSICFDNSGTFRGFDFFDSRNTKLLAGSIKKALEQYLVQHGEAERIVIHYYKKISFDEQKPIWKAINNLQPGVPIYIVSINKTESKDIIGIDLKTDKRMPLSGIYTHLGRNNFLLFNNHRHYKSSGKIKKYPFPIKLQIHEVRDHKSYMEIKKLSGDEYYEAIRIDDATVHEIMSQIVRFSRMYWKSMDPNPLPVTIEYPSLLAEQVPWFKTRKIPEFGKNIPFFL